MQARTSYCGLSHGLSSLLNSVTSKRCHRHVKVCATVALLTLLGLPARSQETPDLTQKSLEDLMNIEVTSVSRKEQKTSQAAAAVFVISREDIRRSGALSIPDLLRMVPGLDVAQIDASKWAITARGFNGQYSDKLLVLIDGRAVYNPIFAGVFWDSQNVPLDSIERIEVIRGPGAAIWGSNAVNGVINIITRKADDTQGGYVAAGLGYIGTGARPATWEPFALMRRAFTTTACPPSPGSTAGTTGVWFTADSAPIPRSPRRIPSPPKEKCTQAMPESSRLHPCPCSHR